MHPAWDRGLPRPVTPDIGAGTCAPARIMGWTARRSRRGRSRWSRSALSLLVMVILMVSLAGLCGCRERSPRPNRTAGLPEETKMVTTTRLSLQSSAFQEGQPIPERYSADGRNLSPPLSWSGLPNGTRSLALVVEDPDAPGAEPFVHWLLYEIPADTSSLPEGIPPQAGREQLGGALQGQNSTGKIGYFGPRPPKGDPPHHYHFQLYALDADLHLPAGAGRQALRDALSGHELARGELIGTFSR